jgi:hypothetical protein
LQTDRYRCALSTLEYSVHLVITYAVSIYTATYALVTVVIAVLVTAVVLVTSLAPAPALLIAAALASAPTVRHID